MEYLLEILEKWLPTIITGLVLYYWQRRQNKHDALKDEAEEVNREVNNATMELSYATAMAVKRGKPNGEVEEAIKAYKNAKKKQEDFNQKLQNTII